MTAIRGILLAGGASSRFGSQKLLHRLDDGETIAEKSARALRGALGGVLAVTRPGSEELKQILLGAGCEVLETERALEGMGGSLAAALEALDDASSFVVALADMPFVEARTIASVRQALLEGASIAIPVFEGRRGHPIGFSSHWAGMLRELGGDQGARNIIAAHSGAVREIAVPDAAILRDIDTPADLWLRPPRDTKTYPTE